MTIVYLVRHAQAEGNLYRRFQGQYDSPLTEIGLRQLEPLSRCFAQISLDAVYSSDLQRAWRTAQAVAEPSGLNVQPEPRLREIDVGSWDNLPFGELEQHRAAEYALLDSDPQQWHPDGAERWEAYTGRFLAALDELSTRHEGQSIALVTHWMVMKQSLQRLFPGQVRYCENSSVSCIEADNGQYRLRWLGDSHHIPPELSTYQAQKALREQPGLHYNLWYQSAQHEPERYIQFRRDAWELVYGNLDGFDGAGFWSTAVRETEEDPEALVYAMCGSRIAGILQLNVNGYAAQDAGYIPFIYLREEFRHKGLGVQLLGYAVFYFRAKGRSKLQLRVAPTNTSAIRFYEKNGFRRIAVTGGRHKLWLMEKAL